MDLYLYYVEGEPYLGTVQDITKALEQSDYAGLNVPSDVWAVSSGTPIRETIRTTSTGFDADDYATVTVRVGLDVATYRMDGRA